MNYRILESLVNLRFDGNIYPVNSREKEILGLKPTRGCRTFRTRLILSLAQFLLQIYGYHKGLCPDRSVKALAEMVRYSSRRAGIANRAN